MNETTLQEAPVAAASAVPVLAHAVEVQEIRDHLLVSGTDIFALGHYPGNPIYPGVLVAERLMQLAEKLAFTVFGQAASVDLLKRIQYLDAVLPGDVVELVASVKKAGSDCLEISALARVGDKPKARATLICTPGSRALAQAVVPKAPTPGERPIAHRELSSILPHRYPFLLIDSIQDHVPGQSVRATKVVNRASPLFLEHLPTTYPHGLIIESIGQAGIALFFLSQATRQPMDIVLGSVGETELLADLPFGVALTVEARIERMLSNGVIFSGQALLGDQVILRIGSLVAMTDPR